MTVIRTHSVPDPHRRPCCYCHRERPPLLVIPGAGIADLTITPDPGGNPADLVAFADALVQAAIDYRDELARWLHSHPSRRPRPRT